MSIELLEQQPDVAKAVWKLIVDSSNVKTSMEVFQGTLKDNKSKAKTEYGVSGSEFTKMLNLYHNQARDEFEEKNTGLLRAYDAVAQAGKA